VGKLYSPLYQILAVAFRKTGQTGRCFAAFQRPPTYIFGKIFGIGGILYGGLPVNNSPPV
jgi:hypothetical protein